MASTARESSSLKSVFRKLKTAEWKLGSEEFGKHFGRLGQQLRDPYNRALFSLRKSFNNLIAEQAKTKKPFSPRTAELIRNTTNFNEDKVCHAIQTLGGIKNPALYDVLKLIVFKNPFPSAKRYAVLAMANHNRPETLGIAVRISKGKRMAKSSCNTMFFELGEIYSKFIKSKDDTTQAVFRAVREKFKEKPADKRLVFLNALLFDKVPDEISRLEGSKSSYWKDFESAKNTLMNDWARLIDHMSIEQLMKKFGLPMA